MPTGEYWLIETEFFESGDRGRVDRGSGDPLYGGTGGGVSSRDSGLSQL